MSESIIIQEDGVAKALTVDKLNTQLGGGGSANWVPEDAFKVGTLRVQRNGTYKASDFGLFGFDAVNVASGSRGGAAAKLKGAAHIGEIHAMAPAIAEGGKAILLSGVHHLTVTKSDSSRLSMMAEPLLTVDDITVTKKGTYRAYDYGKYGFDEVTVNIPYDAGGSGGSGGTPTPPDAIVITRLPAKTTGYVDGEDIDYTGIVVTAYKNGKVWKNDEYPTGVIPFDELILPVEKASAAAQGSTYSNGQGVEALLVDCTTATNFVYYIGSVLHISPSGYMDVAGLGVQSGRIYTMAKPEPGKSLITQYEGRLYTANLEGDNSYNLGVYDGNVDGYESWHVSGSTSARLLTTFSGRAQSEWMSDKIPVSTANPEGVPVSDMSPGPTGQSIPVQWKRAIDGATLSTSFEITIAGETTQGGE